MLRFFNNSIKTNLIYYNPVMQVHLILYLALTVILSFYDFAYRKVPLILLLSLFPLSFWVNKSISIEVIFCIGLPMLCIFYLRRMQLGDLIAYFTASFYLLPEEVFVFFMLNIALLSLTHLLKRSKTIPMIPSILLAVGIVKLSI